MHDFTAAHRTLPFDTFLRVTNLGNGKQTDVRINDRGPFVENRVIDLSLAAARAIDMVGAGVAPVRLEVISEPQMMPGTVRYGVQVGAFQERGNALLLKLSLEARYRPVIIVPYDSPRGLFHRVRVGSLPTEVEARRLAEKLAAEGFTPFVVRLD
jgi:rare lipoprotein A